MDGADFFLTTYYWCFQAWVELTCSLVYTREEWKQLDIKWSVFVIFVILLSSLFTRSNLIWSGQFLPLSFCCRYLCDLCHHNCVLAILLSSLLSSSLSSLVHTIEECKQLVVIVIIAIKLVHTRVDNLTTTRYRDIHEEPFLQWVPR